MSKDATVEPATAEPEYSPCAIYREIAKELKIIADHHDVRIAEALKRFGGSAIHREYRRIVALMHRDANGGEG